MIVRFHGPALSLQSTLSDMDQNLSGLTTGETIREEFLHRRQERHVLYVHNYFFTVNLSGYAYISNAELVDSFSVAIERR